VTSPRSRNAYSQPDDGKPSEWRCGAPIPPRLRWISANECELSVVRIRCSMGRTPAVGTIVLVTPPLPYHKVYICTNIEMASVTQRGQLRPGSTLPTTQYKKQASSTEWTPIPLSLPQLLSVFDMPLFRKSHVGLTLPSVLLPEVSHFCRTKTAASSTTPPLVTMTQGFPALVPIPT
jgi:hypothetical protein